MTKVNTEGSFERSGRRNSIKDEEKRKRKKSRSSSIAEDATSRRGSEENSGQFFTYFPFLYKNLHFSTFFLKGKIFR